MAEVPVITSAVSNSPGWITIAWAHSGAGGPLSFFLERQNPPLTVGPFTNNVDYHTDMGLQPSTSYSYRVCVVYPGGSLYCSGWVAVQTMPPEQPSGAYPAPTITVQDVTSNSITIRWTSAANYGRVHILWREKSEGLNRPQIRINQKDGSRSFPNLEPNTPFVFAMQGCNRTLFGSSCSNWSPPVEIWTAALPLPPPPPPAAPIYAVMPNGDLLWNRHEDVGHGSSAWASRNGIRVGNGWDVLQAFSGGDGIIYYVLENGDLMWNRHEGRNDGTSRWALPKGAKVGVGWQGAAHVFAGHDGAIYAVYNNGNVVWNRHEGRNDGTFRWALPNGRNVGNAVNKLVFWRAAHVFAGGTPGVIYAIMDDGDLLWFRHYGSFDGTARWANGGEGKIVGVGWQVKAAFGLRDSNSVYAAMADGQLLWNLHMGYDDGTFAWASEHSKPVGTGWNVMHAFSG